MGPTPRATRKAHQAVLRLFSEDCIFPPIQGSGGQKIGYTDVLACNRFGGDGSIV